MSSLPLSPQVFTILSRLVEERTGLHYDLDDMDLFGAKISERAVVAGFDSLLEYYYFLRYDPASQDELDALIDALVVGETYLFREADQLHVLVDGVLAPAVAAGRRPRVWSAACATGEEPLSVAMLLAQRGLGAHVDLVASDISARALERARRGELGRRALRALPPGFERWLASADERRPRADPALVETITWRRCNLADPAAVRAMGSFDAIVCRNVLIYFSDETTRRVISSFYDALVPGGHLFVGASESLLRFGTLFACHEERGVFFYRKEVA